MIVNEQGVKVEAFNKENLIRLQEEFCNVKRDNELYVGTCIVSYGGLHKGCRSNTMTMSLMVDLDSDKLLLQLDKTNKSGKTNETYFLLTNNPWEVMIVVWHFFNDSPVFDVFEKTLEVLGKEIKEIDNTCIPFLNDDEVAKSDNKHLKTIHEVGKKLVEFKYWYRSYDKYRINIMNRGKDVGFIEMTLNPKTDSIDLTSSVLDIEDFFIECNLKGENLLTFVEMCNSFKVPWDMFLTMNGMYTELRKKLFEFRKVKGVTKDES